MKTMIFALQVEVCDLCGETCSIGCTGIGPKTEVGEIEVLSVCSRCRLKSLYASITRAKKVIMDYQNRETMLEDYEWESFDRFRNELEEDMLDLRYLVEQTIEYYSQLHPQFFRPLYPGMISDFEGRVYRKYDQIPVQVILIEIGKNSDELHKVATSLALDLGLNSYSVVSTTIAKDITMKHKIVEVLSSKC